MSQSWGIAIRHYGRCLLWPYFLFSLLAYLPWVLVSRQHGSDAALNVEAWRPVIGTLYGIGVDGWLQHNAMLWFFPCLFLTHLVFRMVNALMKSWGQCIVIVVFAWLGYQMSSVLPMRLPWGKASGAC